MGGDLEKCSIQRGVLKKVSIRERGPKTFCVFQNPTKSQGDSTLIRFHPIVPLLPLFKS